MVQHGSVPSSAETFQEAFARIERAVAAGQTDLSELGFWKLVAQIKLDPVLAGDWADQVGRIDRAAFEARVHPRLPVWFGNLVLGVGTGVGVAAIVVAVEASNRAIAGLALIVGAGVLSVCVHDLAHWVVGRLVGMRFLASFLSTRPLPPRPGMKIDYATYLRTPAEARAWMHASGALATKVAPFVALAFWPSSNAPVWAAWVVLGLGVLQIATDVLFSRRSSDWKRVIRERRLARMIVRRP